MVSAYIKTVGSPFSEAILTLWPIECVPEAVCAKPLERMLEYGPQTASFLTICLRPAAYNAIHPQPKVLTSVFEACESDSDRSFLIQLV